MPKTFSRFIADESGATAIEYALIGTLISVTIIVSAGAIGNAVNNLFAVSGNKVNTVSNGLN